MTTPPTTRAATFIGASAVLMWGLLALLTTLSGKVPPFLLAALAFGIATTFVTIKWLIRGEHIRRHLSQPLGAWLLSVSGLFGYHFFYFMALRNAPPVEAGLIAYMWPLLIVLFSALLPGERLRWHHIAGAVAGLSGAALLITGGKGLDGFKPEFTLGFAMAACCALTWSGYSVLNRRFAQVPTDAVGGFCAATALLAALCHIMFETTIWPANTGEWLAVAGLGLLPVGLAFFTWDYGTKHGDIQVLGAFAYAAPLISTILLIAFGKGEATWSVAAGCVLIIGGAVLAAREMLFAKSISGPHAET
jgi:drug/metabolite transporter (DMT)-like permease